MRLGDAIWSPCRAPEGCDAILFPALTPKWELSAARLPARHRKRTPSPVCVGNHWRWSWMMIFFFLPSYQQVILVQIELHTFEGETESAHFDKQNRKNRCFGAAKPEASWGKLGESWSSANELKTALDDETSRVVTSVFFLLYKTHTHKKNSRTRTRTSGKSRAFDFCICYWTCFQHSWNQIIIERKNMWLKVRDFLLSKI